MITEQEQILEYRELLEKANKKIDELSKQAAAIRKYLQEIQVLCSSPAYSIADRLQIQAWTALALSGNAGRDYVPISDVEPLLNALEDSMNIGNIGCDKALAAFEQWYKNHPKV